MTTSTYSARGKHNALELLHCVSNGNGGTRARHTGTENNSAGRMAVTGKYNNVEARGEVPRDDRKLVQCTRIRHRVSHSFVSQSRDPNNAARNTHASRFGYSWTVLVIRTNRRLLNGWRGAKRLIH